MTLRPLINEIKHTLQNINLKPKSRVKRGLINLGGNRQKNLFGTLDFSDGERCDKAKSS